MELRTREVKLGCVFTQTTVDEKGYAVRDESSTSYVGAIERADEFSKRIYGEAMRRGLPRAEKICVIGDGAPWIWNIADEEFSGAIQIIDLYHAREHYWNVARVFWGHDKEKMNQWAKKRHDELDSGKVEEVIKAIRDCCLLQIMKRIYAKEKSIILRKIRKECIMLNLGGKDFLSVLVF